ncbi:hypothetical protein [Aeromicrobium sp. Root472D3]|uniref:hypothetical protein n=1 Tax=Aeromicrobium sp. Root472D3 TaxID=1736540 RepID=UPI0006FCB07E|nr:hypothetical protein [Aeromicrobium sp. Root472D3]KQX75825.1 hypothetical protein ASD10_11955 [Aeromicrobium sp. Root472D3]
MRVLSGVLATTLLAIGAPGSASAGALGITLDQLRPSSVRLTVVCPVDPPTTVLVFSAASSPQLIGSRAITCRGGGRSQHVVVRLSPRLTAGSLVDLSVTVSGDSGEINAWFDGARVEPCGRRVSPAAARGTG